MQNYWRAAEAIKKADAIIVTSGAGMGVDSGLPDFRGNEGFWNSYPAYRKLNINFYEAANPVHFLHNPSLGWGFYGHRSMLYRHTIPHQGFNIIKEWIQNLNLPFFLVTSNVDGHFQKAGFPEKSILEVHGSIHYMQCSTPCSATIWENNEELLVTSETMLAQTIPRCKLCGAVARPNILMFNDYNWISDKTDSQESLFNRFLASNHFHNPVILEVGAGTTVPTIRNLSERMSKLYNSTLIRINPREYGVYSPQHVSIPLGALAGLKEINRIIN